MLHFFFEGKARNRFLFLVGRTRSQYSTNGRSFGVLDLNTYQSVFACSSGMHVAQFVYCRSGGGVVVEEATERNKQNNTPHNIITGSFLGVLLQLFRASGMTVTIGRISTHPCLPLPEDPKEENKRCHRLRLVLWAIQRARVYIVDPLVVRN